MLIGVPKETIAGEMRAPLVPASVKKSETGLRSGSGSVHGRSGGFADAAYGKGMRIETDRAALLGAADLVLRIRKPTMKTWPC